jgi:hypothetical protein
MDHLNDDPEAKYFEGEEQVSKEAKDRLFSCPTHMVNDLPWAVYS